MADEQKTVIDFEKLIEKILLGPEGYILYSEDFLGQRERDLFFQTVKEAVSKNFPLISFSSIAFVKKDNASPKNFNIIFSLTIDDTVLDEEFVKKNGIISDSYNNLNIITRGLYLKFHYTGDRYVFFQYPNPSDIDNFTNDYLIQNNESILSTLYFFHDLILVEKLKALQVLKYRPEYQGIEPNYQAHEQLYVPNTVRQKVDSFKKQRDELIALGYNYKEITEFINNK